MLRTQQSIALARLMREIRTPCRTVSPLGASKSTIKTHLFEKTRSDRQAEFTKLIVGFNSPARTRATNG